MGLMADRSGLLNWLGPRLDYAVMAGVEAEKEGEKEVGL